MSTEKPLHQFQVLSYRKDIDGLRAIAVLAVILFHLGYLPNGYLGVDIFFSISGYLITKIVYNEVIENRFSIIEFYLRRIRRILPLVLFTTLVALGVGLFVMLPDDFENLSQSVFATNFFANNILLLITTGNYWDVVNEYKPLMHTWSLGIEEQFYLFYPVIFLFLNGNRSRFILPVLGCLTAASLLLFFLSSNAAATFYMIQFRFFELSLGGLAAILFKSKPINRGYSIALLLILFGILTTQLSLPADIKLLLVVVTSVGLLLSGENKNKVNSLLLENKLMVGIGKISFSLYMWHQIVLAYTRYFVTDNIDLVNSLVIFTIILILSALSYFLIEQPFRNKHRIKTKSLLLLLGFFFMLTSTSSFYFYMIGGVIRDVPELELYKSNSKLNYGNRKRNIHIEYNARVYDLDKEFTDNLKTKILVIGNSFARDFANILLESKLGGTIDVSYVQDINTCKDINERLKQAKLVFFSELEINQFQDLQKKFNIEPAKVWNVGTKDFGTNNGIFYNKKRDANYCKQRTYMNSGTFERNDILKKQWGKRYIDLIGMIVDENGKVPVFTYDCKFISQDCRHLTHSGAVYFAQLLKFDGIISKE